MTITQLRELLLARLYSYAQSHGYREEVSLNALATELGEADKAKVYSLACDLERDGLIEAEHTMSETLAFITTRGARLVQDGGKTGIISAFQHDPQRYLVSVDQSTHFHGAVSGGNIAVHSQFGAQSATSSQELTEVIERIATMLTQDPKLADEDRATLLSDVRTLQDELQRSKPRAGIIRTLLDTLRNVASISELVTQLQSFLSKTLSL